MLEPDNSGTRIPGRLPTSAATEAAPKAGFRQRDTAERHRTENKLGKAMQQMFPAGKFQRESLFVATKL